MGVIVGAVGVLLCSILHGSAARSRLLLNLLEQSQVILYRWQARQSACDGKAGQKGSCHMDFNMQIYNHIEHGVRLIERGLTKVVDFLAFFFFFLEQV